MSGPPLQHADYGAHPLSRRTRTVLVVLGLLVAVGATTWVYLQWRERTGALSWATIGYDVRSDTVVDVRFSVSKAAEDAVVCRVIAQDDTTLVVGEAEVDIPVGRTDSRVAVALETTSRAVLGRVDTCRAR